MGPLRFAHLRAVLLDGRFRVRRVRKADEPQNLGQRARLAGLRLDMRLAPLLEGNAFALAGLDAPLGFNQLLCRR